MSNNRFVVGRLRVSISAAAILVMCGSAFAWPDNPEVEPNQTKAQATLADSGGAGMATGDTISGSTTGTSTTVAGPASADTFLIRTAAATTGLYRHRLTLTTPGTAGHTLTMRGLSQTGTGGTGGVIGTLDSTVQVAPSAATGDLAARTLQWYGFGKQEQLYVRVTGTSATTEPYAGTLSTTTVTPITIAGEVRQGQVTISAGTGNTFDSAMWVYDSDFNAMPGYGNEDPYPAAGLSSRLTRTFSPGVYYIAYANASLRNNQAGAADDNFFPARLDFPDGVAASSSSASVRNANLRIVHPAGTTLATGTVQGPFEIIWFRMTVATDPPTDPTVAATVAPAAGALPGDVITVSATVTPGANPSTLGHVDVTANLSSLGTGQIPLVDSGDHLTFVSLPGNIVPTTTAPGAYTIGVNVHENVVPNRGGSTSAVLTVLTPSALCGGAVEIAQPADATPVLSPAVSIRGASPVAPTLPWDGVSPNRVLWYRVTPTVCGAWTFSTCAAAAPSATVADTVLGIFASGAGCAGPFTLVASSDDAADCALRSVVTSELATGQTYYVVAGQKGTSVVTDGADLMQIATTFVAAAAAPMLPDPPAGFTNEVEPNQTSAQANLVVLAPLGGIQGISTGSAEGETCNGLATADVFKVRASAAAGITRYRATITSTTPGHTLSVLGLTQSEGVIDAASSVPVQTAASTGDLAGVVQWYGAGTADPTVYLRVTGTAATTDPYLLTLTVEPVTAEEAGSIVTGELTVSSVGRTGATQTNTDLWVYDSDLKAIADWGNDDTITAPSSGSELVRTFAPGTYYIAIADRDLCNDKPSPADDFFRDGGVLDFPDVTLCGSDAAPLDCSVRISGGAESLDVSLQKAGPFDVRWVRLVVTAVPTLACNLADITGIGGPPAVPDGLLTGDDFNAFISAFANDDLLADVTGIGGPPAVSDGLITGDDFNAFIVAFVEGCP